MKNVFIETSNTKKFFEICDELSDPRSMVGPSLAMVTGPAGRGKSESAKYYATNNEAVYLPPLNIRTPVMLLREIAFELGGQRPTRSEHCLTIIQHEMARSRRLVTVDEADLIPINALEMLRNINERYACPILMIGEELSGRIASRRRIDSRIRRRMEFVPVHQGDIAYFFKQALGSKLSGDDAAGILKHCKGDWRPVLTIALSIERAMATCALKEITTDLVKDVLKNG